MQEQRSGVKYAFNDQRNAGEHPDAHEGHAGIEHDDEAEQQGDARADGFQVPHRPLRAKCVHSALGYPEADQDLEQAVQHRQHRESVFKPAGAKEAEAADGDHGRAGGEPLALGRFRRLGPEILDQIEDAQGDKEHACHFNDGDAEGGGIDQQQNTDQDEKQDGQQRVYIFLDEFHEDTSFCLFRDSGDD